MGHPYAPMSDRPVADFLRWKDDTITELGYRVYIATAIENHDVYGDPEQAIADRATTARFMAEYR